MDNFLKLQDFKKIISIINNNVAYVAFVHMLPINKDVIEQIQKHAIELDYRAIKYIENPSETLQWHAVTRQSYAIKYIINPSEQVQLEAVKRNSNSIQYIANPSDL